MKQSPPSSGQRTTPSVGAAKGKRALSAEAGLARPGWRARWGPPGLVVLAGLVAYANSFAGEFILDDYLAIVNNGRLRQLWPLTEFLRDTRPVTDFTFAVNYAIGGLSLAGFHAVNLAIHLAAGLVLHGLIRRTLQLPRFGERTRGASCGLATAVAVLWVVHPLCTQAVTYIVQRSESLMSLFYLLTLYCLLRSATSGRRGAWSVMCIASCLLGMGSKAVMVTAPVTAFLFDVLLLSGSMRAALRARWALYAGLCACVAVLWQVGVIGGLYTQPEGETVTVGFSVEGLSPWRYFLTQCGVILHYLRLCVWPHPLIVDYGWRAATTLREYLPGLAVLIVLGGWTLWQILRSRARGFPAAAFFLVLSPTSSFVPIRDLAFEHRMYLPLAAVITCAVLLADRWMNSRRAALTPYRRILASMSVATVTVVYLILTLARNGQYADVVALWETNVARTPDHPRPINALGFAYYKRGRNEEAARMYERAIALDPFYAGAYANRGILAFSQRRFQEGIEQFRRALEISPHEFGADYYSLYGSALLEVGQVDEAITALETATRSDPGYPDAQYNLGNAYMTKGRLAEAVERYEQVVKSYPGYAEAYVNMGLCLSGLGRREEAEKAYRAGIQSAGSTRLDASFKGHYQLGLLLLEAGRKEEAQGVLEAALRLRPGHEGAMAAFRRAASG